MYWRRILFLGTLEELDDIFNSPNPRNVSLVKKKVAADVHGNILEVDKI